MRSGLAAMYFVGTCALVGPTAALANFSCGGILTDAQRRGFEAMFSPPYSPSLSKVGQAVEPASMAKKLTAAEQQTLRSKGPAQVAARSLSVDNARSLKGWLNENAATEIPGWVSTAAGIVAPTAWVGLSADMFVQLVNAANGQSKLKTANVAGTVSEGGQVGVLEHVAVGSDGKPRFIWTYVYKYVLNGQSLSTPLSICSSDIVTI